MCAHSQVRACAQHALLCLWERVCLNEPYEDGCDFFFLLQNINTQTQTPAVWPWSSPGCNWLVNLFISENPKEKSRVQVLNLIITTPSTSESNELLIKINMSFWFTLPDLQGVIMRLSSPRTHHKTATDKMSSHMEEFKSLKANRYLTCHLVIWPVILVCLCGVFVSIRAVREPYWETFHFPLWVYLKSITLSCLPSGYQQSQGIFVSILCV